ncbi:hypothetical protein [Collimonas antrihumi]|uniref:hypothetical protein n=1 Tax=Collimonas antrihumi TaxID=1940615 RepID=UPI001B8BE06E|nr:hypothetical protein [Collimonas antrihumi]
MMHTLNNLTRNLTPPQRKWGALTVAVLIVALFSLLTGCDSKADQEARQRQKEQDDAMKQLTHQGDGKVRKPGESGFKGY